MAAGCGIERNGLFLAGHRIDGDDGACEADLREDLFNGVVVPLFCNEGKQQTVVGCLVFGQDGLCGGVEGNLYDPLLFLFCLVGNVFKSGADDVVLRETVEVADAATDQALEYEDVTLDGKCWRVVQIAFVKLAHLVEG